MYKCNNGSLLTTTGVAFPPGTAAMTVRTAVTACVEIRMGAFLPSARNGSRPWSTKHVPSIVHLCRFC
eukprot:2385037-Amphidinium_carterae.1